jgi:hypothetical protein
MIIKAAADIACLVRSLYAKRREGGIRLAPADHRRQNLIAVLLACYGETLTVCTYEGAERGMNLKLIYQEI